MLSIEIIYLNILAYKYGRHTAKVVYTKTCLNSKSIIKPTYCHAYYKEVTHNNFLTAFIRVYYSYSKKMASQ